MIKKIGIFICIVWAIGMWVAITSAIFGISNPHATETERFLHIPQAFMLNFKEQ
jgi:hypothetical protein